MDKFPAEEENNGSFNDLLSGFNLQRSNSFSEGTDTFMNLNVTSLQSFMYNDQQQMDQIICDDFEDEIKIIDDIM